ncbi:MAG: ATP-binding cassette domain-containing protein [Coriobacteriales bacterium]|nr:ATP-binding cassette domain-containing protein [Coriobacteriales bacterium]
MGGVGASADKSVLEAHDLTLSWDGGEHIVAEHIDLVVRKGETVCLVGRSGCGKTTILHALSGLTQPLAGEVLLHGEDVSGKPGRVSYMLQKDLLLPHLRIIDNVCLPLTIAGTKRDAAREKARPLFARFGLEGCELKWPSELSGGMRQRAAFLRTYLMGNDVVLLDEPFSALDALTREDLRSWYVRTAAELGIASLVITHDVDEAVSMASRIYVLQGNPGAGEPSHVAAEVVVPREENFELTHAYVDCKREVLSLLT